MIVSKLKESGYSIYMIGKWYIGFYKREFILIQRGFDFFFGYLIGGEDYYIYDDFIGYLLKGYSGLNGYDMWRNVEVVVDVVGNYLIFLFINEVVDIIFFYDLEIFLFFFVVY